MIPKTKVEENGRRQFAGPGGTAHGRAALPLGVLAPMEGGNPVNDVLNLDEASRYLRIKRRTLYSLAARGVVPGAKIGGQWRFRRSQLESLFAGGPPPGQAPGAGEGGTRQAMHGEGAPAKMRA